MVAALLVFASPHVVSFPDGLASSGWVDFTVVFAVPILPVVVFVVLAWTDLAQPSQTVWVTLWT